ncbi:MAG: metallophosphoesterase family protein [Candidatus Thermoplasmatota archaeon]|nr:metallophosphoesterase family protein [Candidatus Thermoplasmatota archaeon]
MRNPDSIQLLDACEIHKILRFAIPIFTAEPPLIEIPKSGREILFAGDTHGDFETTKRIAARFLGAPKEKILVFLGDYIDRAPKSGESVSNIAYLFALKCAYPESIFLLKGNHEANYAIPCFPYEFDTELRGRFGFEWEELHEQFIDAFREMPLMLRTENGIFAAHAGFPQRRRKLEKSGESLLMDVVWADPEISETHRGPKGTPRFSEAQLAGFLEGANCRAFVRGHDYHTLGTAIYGARCLTIFSARQYAQFGGVLLARARLDQKIKNALDLQVEDVSSGEWKPYKVKVL